MGIAETSRQALGEVMAASTSRNSVGKHYVPFSAEEWDKLKKATGQANLQPAHIKKLIFRLFETK